MKESHIGKMKSLLVAMLMIASVIAVFEMTEPVQAGAAGHIHGALLAESHHGRTVYRYREEMSSPLAACRPDRLS